MPFWSRGAEEEKPEAKNFSDDSFSSSDSFAAAPSSYAGSDDPAMSAASGLGDMQQFSMALKQQMMVQTVINQLTDKAFEKCITGKPGDSLGGRDAACVNAVVCKWLDTNEFMTGRLERKMGGGGM